MRKVDTDKKDLDKLRIKVNTIQTYYPMSPDDEVKKRYWDLRAELELLEDKMGNEKIYMDVLKSISDIVKSLDKLKEVDVEEIRRTVCMLVLDIQEKMKNVL